MIFKSAFTWDFQTPQCYNVKDKCELNILEETHFRFWPGITGFVSEQNQLLSCFPLQ